MKLVRCPYAACSQTFLVADDLVGRPGACPVCECKITLRDAALLAKVEQEHAKRVATGTNRGGGSDNSVNSGIIIGGAALSALVEDVRSLWNVGSIFRTADGAGFSRLYLCGITGCPPRKEISKTSLGAENSVSWESYACALDVLPELKGNGIFLLGLEKSDSSDPLSDFLASKTIKMPLCLLVGNEVTGLSAEVLSQCDKVVHLPMRGVKESLNVSVAFGIAAYAIAEAATLSVKPKATDSR